MSTPTVLPAAVLARLTPASSRRFLLPALLRSLLYLAAAAPLLSHLLPPPVPATPAPVAAGVLVAGWAAVAALHRRRYRPLVGLLLGAGQALTVVLIWRAGEAIAPAGMLPASLLPVLLAIPLIELGVAWHHARLAAALARYDDREQHLRYLRRSGWATLTALLPPLLAAAALTGAAARLPYGLSAHPDAPAVVLGLAAGVLATGVLALIRLLAAHNQATLAMSLTAAPVPGTFGLALAVPDLTVGSLDLWGSLLPALVVVLAVAYAAGLVLATQVLFSPRSYQ